MRRTHKRTRRGGHGGVETFDTDYIFDSTHPRLLKIIDYPRKTVFINADADADADGVQIVKYGSNSREA